MFLKLKNGSLINVDRIDAVIRSGDQWRVSMGGISTQIDNDEYDKLLFVLVNKSGITEPD